MKRILILLAMLMLMRIMPVYSKGSGAQTPKEAHVPIIMYHSLMAKKTNDWNIFPDEFERDMKYLSENGYETVFISDLIRFVYEGAPLPDKPVVLTFDDGYYNNYTNVMPLLEKYDKKMVLSVIGSSSDHWTKHPEEKDERYGHLTWPQISEMVATERVELANHTQNLHKKEGGRKGCRRKDGEDYGAYEKMLMKDLEALQTRIEEVSGKRPQCFTYPFGSYCTTTDEVLRKMGFKVTLSCASGVNILLVGDKDALWKMKRNNRTPERSVEKILTELATR